jgi:cytochrome c5
MLCAAALFALMASAALAQDPSAAVMGACGKCHGVNKVCAGLGKDKAAWDAIVTRMMGKGAQVADKAAVVDWLSAQPAGAKPPCQ